MRKNYDFSGARQNPNNKQQITIRLDRKTIDYFKMMADKEGIPYQNLINLYLRDCRVKKRTIALEWPEPNTDKKNETN